MSDQPATTWRERLSSALTWHYVGFALLLILVIGLSIRLGMDWVATNGHSSDALALKQMELKTLDLQTAPLRGLQQRVDESRSQIQSFYDKRIPPNYSSIATRIGELQVKSGVHLTRVGYTQGKPGSYLTEISLDAGVSGGYPQIMHFINALERDQTFFVIRAMGLTGQQGGLVNLRLQVSTWLRPEAAEASGLPQTPEPGGVAHAAPAAKAIPPAAGKEGE